MTPFRKRPHLRIAGFADATDGEVMPDPNTPPQAPPPPRVVTAQPGDVMPETNTPPQKDLVSGAKDLVVQGIFVGIGYGLASEILKWLFEPKRGPRSSGLSGTVRRRKPKTLIPG